MQVRIEKQILHDIADKVREKNKETEAYKASEIADAVDRILVTEPNIEMLEVTENGVYEVPLGVHGYSPIIVDVQPELEELTATENGEYNPTTYGFSKVTIDVQPELENITITDNGEYKSDKYGFDTVIVNCPPAPTDEDLTLTGQQRYSFFEGKFNWLLEKYANRITTKDITDCNYMFQYSSIEHIPFTINIKGVRNIASIFNNCNNLKVCPKIRGTFDFSSTTTRPTLTDTVTNCCNLRDIEDLLLPEMLDAFAETVPTNGTTMPKYPKFTSMYSLRQLPSWFYKFKLNPNCTYAVTTGSYMLYYSLFNYCYVLDEILDIPVWTWNSTLTTNAFASTFNGCYRVKDITFETNPDGSAIATKWKAQTIDLSGQIGHASNLTETANIGYNSGITKDKLIWNDATYQALKNDPDSFAGDSSTSMGAGIGYSRYNHDSAVRTINSLPDTSAYLATAGGTNTIKFKGNAGSNTDAGAINTLTEEEIAVATAKGWTVTLV